jgi:hypothetical protein
VKQLLHFGLKTQGFLVGGFGNGHEKSPEIKE